MGYDPRAVKISKSVKRVAATILDNRQRREFIRGYVVSEAELQRSKTSRNRRDRSE